jgi:hypothetical protein
MKMGIELLDGDDSKDQIVFTYKEWEDFIDFFELQDLHKMLDRKDELSITIPVSKQIVNSVKRVERDLATRYTPKEGFADHRKNFEWFRKNIAASEKLSTPVLVVSLQP